MVIAGSVKIELDYKQQADTVISILKQDYESLAATVHDEILESEKRELEAFEKDDLSMMISTLEAMDKVMWNYMNPSEYDSWCYASKKTRKLYDRMQ